MSTDPTTMLTLAERHQEGLRRTYGRRQTPPDRASESGATRLRERATTARASWHLPLALHLPHHRPAA